MSVVLVHITNTLQKYVLVKMAVSNPAQALKILQTGQLDYYENGRLGCLLGAFSMPATAEKFRTEMRQLAAVLLRAVEKLIVQLSVSHAEAKIHDENFFG